MARRVALAEKVERSTSYEVTAHLCRCQRRSCDVCPRCFHGLHRCQWCWSKSNGLPAVKAKVRARCAACGRFKAGKIETAECRRCINRGFHALTLF